MAGMNLSEFRFVGHHFRPTATENPNPKEKRKCLKYMDPELQPGYQPGLTVAHTEPRRAVGDANL